MPPFAAFDAFALEAAGLPDFFAGLLLFAM